MIMQHNGQYSRLIPLHHVHYNPAVDYNSTMQATHFVNGAATWVLVLPLLVVVTVTLVAIAGAATFVFEAPFVSCKQQGNCHNINKTFRKAKSSSVRLLQWGCLLQ
jgi:hypothetical protein